MYSSFERFHRLRKLRKLTEASKKRFLEPAYSELEYDEESRDLVMSKTKYASKELPQCEDLVKFVDSGAIGATNIDWNKFHIEINGKTPSEKWNALLAELAKIVEAYYSWKKKGGSRKDRKTVKMVDPNLIFAKNKMHLSVTEGPELKDYDMLHLKDLDNDKFIFYVPLNHKACVWMDSFDCGGEGAKWCIGQSDKPSYWDHYLMDDNYFVLAFNKESFASEDREPGDDTLKYMLQVHYSGFKDGESNSTTSQAWCQSDSIDDTIHPESWPKKFGVSLEQLVDAIEDNKIMQTEYHKKSGEDFRSELVAIARRGWPQE